MGAGRSVQVIGWLLAAGIMVLAGATAWHLRGVAIAHEAAGLRNIALVLAAHTARSFSVLDVLAGATADQIAAGGMESWRGRRAHDLLRERMSAVPQARALLVFDETGDAVAYSRQFPTPRINVADREYFRRHAQDGRREPLVTGPIRNRITGEWTINLTRPVIDAGGVFRGVVLLSVEPEYYGRLFSGIQFDEQATFALFTQDGTLLLRHPHVEEAIGMSFAGRSRTLGAAGETWEALVDHGRIDGMRRLIVYHRVPGMPLVLAVTLGMDGVLAQWRGQAATVLGGALVMAVLALLLARQLAQHLGARERRAHEAEAMRRQLEEKVEERTRTLRKLSRAVEQSGNMVFITDLDGVIEYVNPRFCELTGYTADEAIGRTPRLIKSGDTPAEVYPDMWTSILTGKVWRGEIKDRRKDGRVFWASVTLAPVRDDGGAVTHFVATHEDITARKLAEEEIRIAKDQADIANRAKTELLANMSHELRTPLNAIIGFSDSMLHEVFGPLGNERYRQYIADIQSSGRHLLELINDILDASALETGRLKLIEEGIDLAAVIQAALRLVAPRAAEGKVTLSSRFQPGLPAVWADERRIKQIMLNLLSNAVKFTPPGGRVEVSAGIAEDGDIVVAVADSGIGMTPEEVAIAMTRFGQVDSGLARRHEGTGLGLPLTQGLVELHGGRMLIDSRKWEGTTIQVRLPAERVRQGAKAEVD